MKQEPALFGVSGKSNRGNSNKKSLWGKNEFNAAFPAALLCYMHSKSQNPVYIKTDHLLKTYHTKIPVSDIFNLDPLSNDIFFSFEDTFAPYSSFIYGSLERSDLVILDNGNKENKYCTSLEIKLTALPDSSTYNQERKDHSCELVIRRPAIIHLAMSFISSIPDIKKKEIKKIPHPVCKDLLNKWGTKEIIAPRVQDLAKVIDELFISNIKYQKPFVIQPVWRTVGKSSVLDEHCLDVFVWSDFAFSRLFIDDVKNNNGFGRPQRSVIWLARMLYDYSVYDEIDTSFMKSELAYEEQNDKAFAVNGKKTLRFLASQELEYPRIKKGEIKNIILGGGQNLLSPERRFDAVLVNTPGLFE